MTSVTLSPLFYPPLNPSFFSVSHPPLFPPDLVASSSFKNHFTLGKARHQPFCIWVCAEWLRSISSSTLYHSYQDGRSCVPRWHRLCLTCMWIWLFLLGHFERRHGALYSLNHPSHGWPVSHAVQSGSIFFLISQVSPLQSPDLKAGRVKERRT